MKLGRCEPLLETVDGKEEKERKLMTGGRSWAFHVTSRLWRSLGGKDHLIIWSFAFMEQSGDSKQANKHAKVMFLIM